MRESLLLLFSLIEALALPYPSREQRRSPRIVYKRQYGIKSIKLFADSVINIHLMDVIVALFF